eukprot:jgi/Undpi1/7216/HiC_scaffold_22.g09689.m1
MKSPAASSAFSLLSLLLFNNSGVSYAATTMEVGSCEDLQEAAAATASGDVVAELTNSVISCDNWTSIAVDSNKLKIKLESSSANFYLNNIRFEEVNGGVLNVESGGYARFLETVRISNIVVSSETDGGDHASDVWHGGAIYNEGKIRFDEHVYISGCESQGGGESGPGDGGAIYNSYNGKIALRNGVSMTENRSYDDGSGDGGAIYNLGTITVHGARSEFKDNVAAVGGAIYNEGYFHFDEDAMASFIGNRAPEGKGGHVLNRSYTTFEGGALFYGGYAETGGALGIEDGVVTIDGPALFVGNTGYWYGGGAAFVGENASLATDNADLVFLANVGGDDECDDIYYSTADSNGDFTCSS